MPRFVLLEHDHPHLHWDLMFEMGETLKTWRLSAPLGSGQQDREHDLHQSRIDEKIPAEALPDHRLIYLEYEGPVSNNRGEVRRIEAGWYHPLLITEDRWELRLEGTSWRGFVTLARHLEKADEWTLTGLADEADE